MGKVQSADKPRDSSNDLWCETLLGINLRGFWTMGSGMPKLFQWGLLVLAVCALIASMSVASVKYALWKKKPPAKSYLVVAVVYDARAGMLGHGFIPERLWTRSSK